MAVERVDPAVGGAAQAKFFAADIATLQFGQGTVIDAGVAVDAEYPGGLGAEGHPVADDLAAPIGGALHVVAEDADIFARGPDLGDAVEAEEFAPFAGRTVLDRARAGGRSRLSMAAG